jgi:hypothetical protein
MTKARFEKLPDHGVEWTSLLAQHFPHHRGRLRQPAFGLPLVHLVGRIVAWAVWERALRPGRGFGEVHDLIGDAASVVFQWMVASPDRKLGVLGE